MVARAEQQRNRGSDPSCAQRRVHENCLLRGYVLASVVDIPVPDDTGRFDSVQFLHHRSEGIVDSVGVIDHAEVRVCLTSGRHEAVGLRIVLIAGDVHAVTMVVPDSVCADPEVVPCGRFQPGQTDLHDILVHPGNPVAPALDTYGILKIRSFRIFHISVRHRTDSEGDAHGGGRIVLKHRRCVDQLPLSPISLRSFSGSVVSLNMLTFLGGSVSLNMLTFSGECHSRNGGGCRQNGTFLQKISSVHVCF